MSSEVEIRGTQSPMRTPHGVSLVRVMCRSYASAVREGRRGGMAGEPRRRLPAGEHVNAATLPRGIDETA
jgi:hypothetical protein